MMIGVHTMIEDAWHLLTAKDAPLKYIVRTHVVRVARKVKCLGGSNLSATYLKSLLSTGTLRKFPLPLPCSYYII